MQILGVYLARVFAFLPQEELDRHGRFRPTEFTAGIVQRYGFLKFPQKIEDYTSPAGQVYEQGKWGDIVINRLTVTPAGFAVDTVSSTENSEKVLEDMLAWAVTELGATYKAGAIRSKTFVTQLTFTSDLIIGNINPKLEGFAKRITDSVSSALKQNIQFQPSGVVFQFDLSTTSTPLSSFRIERREGFPFSENKYFSQSPLPTAEHIQFLEDLETALKS